MEPHLQAAGAGVLAGLRSLGGPASVSRQLDSPVAKRILFALALGESVIDKLPFAPARTAKAPLLGRIASGAVSAALLSRARKRSVFVGAVIGGLAAFVATHAAFQLRRTARRKLKVPNALLGLIEDALAVRLGTAVAAA